MVKMGMMNMESISCEHEFKSGVYLITVDDGARLVEGIRCGLCGSKEELEG